MIIVLSGPGGVGKGTVVERLLQRDPNLWLSRSWTTRQRRPGEPDDAYTFVDRATFEARIAEGGFLEHAEFLGNLYGTPFPDELPAGNDVVLEIDVQGARQIRAREPSALLVFLDAPTLADQEHRLQGRGDPPEEIARRLECAAAEREVAQALGAVVVVNDRVDRAVDEIVTLIEAARTP